MKKLTVKYLLGTMALVLLFGYCSRPKEVLDRKSMERLMYDIYIAEAMIDNDYSSFNTPLKKEALINEVFKKHKTTQAQWDTSLSWYSDRIEIYLKMNDSVRARLKRDKTTIEDLLAKENSLLQSIKDRSILTSDIPVQYSFSEVNPKNGFRFRLDSAKIADQITDSIFSFSFDAIAIPQNMPDLLTTMLMFEYKDTTIYKADTINENRFYKIDGNKYINIDTVYNDSTRIIESISRDTLRTIIGFVHLKDIIGLYKGIHLKNIFLGSESDTIMVVPADSSITVRDDVVKPVKPDRTVRKRQQAERIMDTSEQEVVAE